MGCSRQPPSFGGTGTHCNLKLNCCGNASSSSSPCPHQGVLLAREGATPGTAVCGSSSASSFREPWEGRWSGEGVGITLAATPGCHPCQLLLPWARNRTVAATRASLFQSRLPCRLWALKHHPAHVWLIQTSGHTEAPRPCSDCSAETGGPHQKAKSQTTTSTPLPPV